MTAPTAIENGKAWASRRRRHYSVWGLGVIAVLLAIVGAIGLLS